MQQLFALTREQATGRNARPGADHRGNVIFGDLIANHAFRLAFGLAGLSTFGLNQLLFKRWNFAVEQTRCLLEVGLALSALSFDAQGIEFGL